MAHVIAFANQKGGVGKTTTTVNLGAFCAEAGRKVLIIDIDPQGNAGSALGIDIMQAKPNIYDVMLGRADINETIIETQYKNLYMLPSNIDLSGLEIDLRQEDERDHFMQERLAGLDKSFDLVLIDCPPSLGLLTINALTAANSVLIPLQCEYLALEGLTQLLRIIRLVQSGLNPELALEGVLLTMYDSRTRLSAQVVQDVREHFKGQVFEVIIPRNVKLSEAPSFGQPIGIYDPSSSGSASYRKVARELFERTRVAVN